MHGAPARLPNRIVWLLALAVMALGANGVALTYSQIGVTYDEPAHIYTGMEWWLTGDYTIEPLHPPLARAAVSGLLYMSGIVPAAAKEAAEQGQDVQAALLHLTWDSSHQLLYEGGDIFHRLTLARLGVLPFYLLSMMVVFLWTRKLFGNEAALLSLLLYALLPNTAAHAGVATTDMPYTALALAALYAFSLWLEAPSRSHALALGAFSALAATAKFSALMQLPAAMLAMGAWHLYHHRLPAKKYFGTLPWIIAVAALVIAAVYRFQPIEPIVEGIRQVMAKNARGHANVFLGALHEQGNLWYFPVVWFFKTPLAFLLALAVASAALRKHRPAAWQPAMAALGILAVSMMSQINIGVRHILPMEGLLAIAAGAGIVWLAARFKRAGAAAAALLVCWQAYDFAASYPDRISYFNPLTGSNPSWIASDSNFDWGQDNLRLLYALKAHKVETVALCMPFTIKDIYPLLHQEFRLLPCPDAPQPGWVAVTSDEVMLASENKSMPWLKEHSPVENIGRTAKLYYIFP